MATHIVVAIPLALLAATTFAVSAVLQQKAARDTTEKESLSWRLIVDLLHRKAWLAGMGCVALGYVLQAAAFGFAPIAVVEPVVGVEVVLALPLAAHIKKRRLGRREWIGATFVVLGVGAFLALSAPSGGNPLPGLERWGLVAPALVIAAGVVVTGRLVEGPARAPLLAAAAGVSFGLVALLTQSLVHVLGNSGVPALFESWQLYALALVGPLAFTVAQSAYQAGPLAMSLPVIDSLEPTVAVVLAAIAFRQHISLAPFPLAGELVGAAMAITGIFLLARSPLVLAVYEQTEREKKEEEEDTPSPRRENGDDCQCGAEAASA